MTYRIITTYQDGGEIKTHVETGDFQGAGISGVLSIRRKHITDTGGIEIQAGNGCEWIALAQIQKVRVEPVIETPAQDEKPAAKGKPKTKTQFSHALGGGG